MLQCCPLSKNNKFQNMNKVLKAQLLSFAAVATIATTAFSAGANETGYGQGVYGPKKSACPIVYGGGQVCPPSMSYTLNKLVQAPLKGGEFVENLSINDPRFAIGQEVTYRIVVKNTGSEALNNIQITDTLPAEVAFVASSGKHNSANRTVTFTINKLDAGKEAEFFITGRVENVKTDQNVLCVANTVKSVDANRNAADDQATICIDVPAGVKKVQEKPQMKEIPATGPELFSLVALAPSGALGFYLRRKSIKS